MNLHDSDSKIRSLENDLGCRSNEVATLQSENQRQLVDWQVGTVFFMSTTLLIGTDQGSILDPEIPGLHCKGEHADHQP